MVYVAKNWQQNFSLWTSASVCFRVRFKQLLFCSFSISVCLNLYTAMFTYTCCVTGYLILAYFRIYVNLVHRYDWVVTHCMFDVVLWVNTGSRRCCTAQSAKVRPLPCQCWCLHWNKDSFVAIHIWIITFLWTFPLMWLTCIEIIFSCRCRWNYSNNNMKYTKFWQYNFVNCIFNVVKCNGIHFWHQTAYHVNLP